MVTVWFRTLHVHAYLFSPPGEYFSSRGALIFVHVFKITNIWQIRKMCARYDLWRVFFFLSVFCVTESVFTINFTFLFFSFFLLKTWLY